MPSKNSNSSPNKAAETSTLEEFGAYLQNQEQLHYSKNANGIDKHLLKYTQLALKEEEYSQLVRLKINIKKALVAICNATKLDKFHFAALPHLEKQLSDKRKAAVEGFSQLLDLVETKIDAINPKGVDTSDRLVDARNQSKAPLVKNAITGWQMIHYALVIAIETDLSPKKSYEKVSDEQIEAALRKYGWEELMGKRKFHEARKNLLNMNDRINIYIHVKDRARLQKSGEVIPIPELKYIKILNAVKEFFDERKEEKNALEVASNIKKVEDSLNIERKKLHDEAVAAIGALNKKMAEKGN